MHRPSAAAFLLAVLCVAGLASASEIMADKGLVTVKGRLMMLVMDYFDRPSETLLELQTDGGGLVHLERNQASDIQIPPSQWPSGKQVEVTGEELASGRILIYTLKLAE